MGGEAGAESGPVIMMFIYFLRKAPSQGASRLDDEDALRPLPTSASIEWEPRPPPRPPPEAELSRC